MIRCGLVNNNYYLHICELIPPKVCVVLGICEKENGCTSLKSLTLFKDALEERKQDSKGWGSISFNTVSTTILSLLLTQGGCFPFNSLTTGGNYTEL